MKPLTKRQQQILQYLYGPLPYKQIAAELNISQKTLEVHINNVKERIRSGPRIELMAARIKELEGKLNEKLSLPTTV
jgi:DNA-binding NarL/FixJ family response regulator